MKTSIRIHIGMVALSLSLVGCGGDSASFSVLPSGDTFYQGTGATDTRIDILWVIDNSGSMQTSQNNLANNFPSFIDDFSSRNLDFQMAVAASDNYIALPAMTPIYNSLSSSYYIKQRAQSTWAGFRDGDDSRNIHSGHFVLNALTPNLNSVFVTNATIGINGLGDERLLQSMKTTLDSSLTAGFVRPNSFLAVILLTDEDDFSHDGTTYLENQYSNPALHTIASYKSYLDALTGSNDARRRYNVHSIAIQDDACRASLGSGRKIGRRVNEMADATGGIRASLCGNFADSLELIAENIIELSTQFYLSRIPDPATIEVTINGQIVPSSGWYYNSTANSIVFQGDYIPPQGAAIQVTFDPISLGG